MTDARDHDPDRLLARAADALRHPSPRDAAARAALVRHIRDGGGDAEPVARAVRAAPRRWSLSPAAALVAAPLVFALGVATGGRGDAGGYPPTAGGGARGVQAATRPAAAPPPASGQRVEFVLAAPSARRVSLVGEFNGWDPAATPMRLARDGRWAVALDLAPGRHVYAFVVDDTAWVPDPEAPIAPEHWFGSRNSVVVVPASSRL